MSIYGLRTRHIENRPLKAVLLDQSKDRLTLAFVDGTTATFTTEGGCCSRSWIEHLEMPGDIVGAVILSVDSAEMPPWDGHECGGIDNLHSCGHDSLAVYHTKFHTDRGDIVLEYRNDSNGYYGGSLINESPPGWDAE